MEKPEIVTISHGTSGIRIEHSAGHQLFANVEYLAVEHAKAMVRLHRYESMERMIIDIHKRISDQVQKSGTEGLDFVPIRDMLRDLITQ